MRALLIPVLIMSIFPGLLVAQDQSQQTEGQTGPPVTSSATPSQAQHQQTDLDFLSERARRSENPPDEIAELETIGEKLQSLRGRLQYLESESQSASAREHILLGRQVGAAGEPVSEKRIPDTLTHRDRAVREGDDYGRVKVRISALEESAKSELARMRQWDTTTGPGADAEGSSSPDGRSGEIRFGDGVHGRRLPGTDSANTNGQDAELASSRKRILQLQRDVDAVEREVEYLERREDSTASKKPGRLK